MCNVFINKVQLAFGNEEGIVSLCLNDDTKDTKLHSTTCCYLYKKFKWKIYVRLIGWNLVHLSCNTGAKLEHKYKLQIARVLSKFRLPCLWEIPFSCILLLSKNMISRAISCKRALEKYSETTNCTHPTGSWNIWSLKSLLEFNTKFHPKSCQY